MFFSSSTSSEKDTSSHIIIPTSIVHSYETKQGGSVYRNSIYIKKYASDNQDKNPIIFFHGGPNVVNEEQFSHLVHFFINKGHVVYIPEIEGSSMYTNGICPKGFIFSNMDEDVKLFSLKGSNGTGLNEHTKNYAEDVKDVLNFVSSQHPHNKMNLITHSLGCHHVLRTLQHVSELKEKIEAICNVAGTYDMGANRLWRRLGYLKLMIRAKNPDPCGSYLNAIVDDCEYYLKSSVTKNQLGSQMTKENNPCVNQQMNKDISVLYGDVSKFPPTMLIHAKNDTQVFFQNSVLLYEQIEQNGGIVHGLFLETGEHGIIKDEGDPIIRTIALEKMLHFFDNPALTTENDLTNLIYDNVVADHHLFLNDQDAYFQKQGVPPKNKDEEPVSCYAPS